MIKVATILDIQPDEVATRKILLHYYKLDTLALVKVLEQLEEVTIS